MFNRQYFAARQFAPRYFPPVEAGGFTDEVIAPGRRALIDNEANANVTIHDTSYGHVRQGGEARGRVKVG